MATYERARLAKRAKRAAVATAAAFITAAAPAVAADPGQPVATWVPDGPVNAVEVTGDTAYLGGSFTRLGPYTGGAVTLDGENGAQRTGFPDVSGSVETALADGKGGWYIGGSFTAVGGQKRANLAHILPDGSVDPAWAPAADKPVNALAITRNTVIAGGSFTNVAGVAHTGLVELDPATGKPTAWPGSVDGTVNTIVVGGTQLDPVVFVGGRFNKAVTTNRLNVAGIALDGTATVAQFNPSVNGEVFDLEIGPRGIYAGGEFDKVNSTVDRTGLASFEPATGVVTKWDPGLRERATVYDIDIGDKTLYAGGRLEGANIGKPSAVNRDNAAAFDTESALVTPWDPHPNAEVFAVEATPDRVYLGGRFTRVGAATDRFRLAAVDATAGTPLPFDPSPNGAVRALARNGGDVFVGGDLTSIGGVTRNNLAAIDLKTGRPTEFDANVNGPVYALDSGPTGIWAGGDFSKVNGQTDRSRLAVFNATTGRTGEFSQVFDQAVRAVAVDGTTIYAGGVFEKVSGGIIRNRVAAFREVPGTGGVLLPFDPNVNGPVYAVLPTNGRVYLGGMFTTIGNGTALRTNAGAVDAGNGSPTPWNPAVNQPVQSLTQHRGTIVAGGSFDKVNATVTRRGVAAFNPDDGLVTAFDGQITGSISSVESDTEQLYAGGLFGPTGSPAEEGLGLFDTAVPGLGTWRPNVRLLPGGGLTGTTMPVNDIAVDPGRWLVAGGSLKIDTGPVRTTRFAAFPLSPLPTRPQQPNGNGGNGGNGGGTPPDTTAPKLTTLKASRKKFRAGRLPRRGTTLSITLDEASTVTYETLVAKTGTKAKNGTCRVTKRKPAKGKRCTVLVPVARFTQKAPAGTSRVSYTAKAGKKALKPGTYTVRATPTDAAGNVGKARSLKVKVIK